MKNNTKNIREGVTAILFVAIMIVCAFAVVPMVKAGSDTTWTLEGSPYYITEDFLVEEGVTLTIEPGVEAKFDPGIALQVDGQLIAQGAEENAIIFTSNSPGPAPGDWNGILFTDTSVPATYDDDGYYTSGCIMQYCTVEYGGGSNTPAIKVVSSSLFVDHCTVVNNAWSGIYVQGTVIRGAGGGIYVGSARITNNLISDNSAQNGGGISTGRYTTVTISGNTIRGNSASQYGGGIRIERSGYFGCSATISDNIISDNSANWGGGGIDIGSNSAVTISGNTIRSNSANYGAGINVGPFNEVAITGNSISDNSAKYGGGGISAHSSKVTISGNTISNNRGGGGLRFDDIDGSSAITDNVITGNAGNGIGLRYFSQPTINYNDIYDNTPYDIYTSYCSGCSGRTPDVDATNNCWGTTDEAVIQEHIYDGNDDPRFGIVSYIPFSIDCIANQPPVADAGPDQTVEQTYYPGADVTLDGSGSNDPDGDPLTYTWTWDDGSAAGVNPTVSLPLGTTTITLIVNDGTVDSDSDTVVITVQDTTPPVITCLADVTVEQESADGTVVSLTATATDICDASPTITSDELAIYPLGKTTVTFTATDNAGNSASCSMTVTVVDTTDPVITCPEDVTVEQETADGTVVPLTATATDICDADPMITSSGELPIYPLGSTTVTFTAEDDSGNTASCTTTVTVVDTTDPVITCPEDVTVEQETADGTVVTLTATATDICDADPMITSSGELPIYPLGSTTVTFTAEDDSGNTASCTTTVTVVDTTDPVITCPEDVTVEQETADGTVVTLTATATDICDADPMITSSGELPIYPLGSTTVTFTAEDDSGNTASCTTTVTVVDTTDPVITCPEDVTVEQASAAGTVVPLTATATDICDADPMITSSGELPIYPLGSTTVTFTAEDDSGNTASCTTTVTVVDTTDPVITCPEDVTVEQASAGGTAVPLTATATDICDADPMITSSGELPIYPLGSTTVTFTAEDDSGNTASCTTTVTVVDTTDPVITCPEDVTVEQASAGGTVVTLTATATDICDASPTITSDELASYPLGTTTVTFTATDNAGNSASCSMTVTVEDTTPPVITCPADVTVEQETADGTVVPLTATATDICDASPTITSDELAIYPLGKTTVTFTATDDSGNSASCSMTVTVVDKTPPVISVAVSPDTLWPANHKIVDITATVTATDICDADPTVVLTSVTSNEPEDAKGNGDGKTVDDIQGADVGTADYSFQLRAERDGKGDGRIYTITYMVTDESGNSASASATVVVPHDMG